MADLLQTIYSDDFLSQKILVFWFKCFWTGRSNFSKHYSWRSNHQWVRTSSDNGLMLRRWQAIIWANDNSWFMHIKYRQGSLRKYNALFVNMGIWADNITVWYKIPIFYIFQFSSHYLLTHVSEASVMYTWLLQIQFPVPLDAVALCCPTG